MKACDEHSTTESAAVRTVLVASTRSCCRLKNERDLRDIAPMVTLLRPILGLYLMSTYFVADPQALLRRVID